MSNITVREANSLVKEYYTDYAKYVLATRALPSLYDGFKHAQRRLTYVGSKLPSKFSKSSKILGDTIPYHPHGLDSLYSTLVNMTTPSNRFRLFKGKGNWGGPGFGAAAYRYTEAFLEDYAKFCYTQFIDYADYIQGESGLDEPEFLPSLVPYSNIVGASGIGVGLSTNVMPLNLMELIDYYIAIIKGETPKVPTPDIGNFIINMWDDDIDSAVSGYRGKLYVKPIITQESGNILVVEDLFNKDINKIVWKLRDLIDSGKVDYRNESSTKNRYVFEINDNSVDIKELTDRISKYTESSMTFTRIVVDRDKAVYCNLKYQVEKTLEYLNHVLDTKFAKELSKLQFSEQVLMAIEYIKSSGLVNVLGTMSTDELKSDIINKGGFSPEVAGSAVAKPITYLTKSHLNELTNIRAKIKENQNTNRTDYLINLYEEFRKIVSPLYYSHSHSIRYSKLLSTPRVHKIPGTNSIRISNRGLKYKNNIVVVTTDGMAYPKSIFSNIKKDIELDTDKLCDIATDSTSDVILYITNKEGILANEFNRIKYYKSVITLDDDEYVQEIRRIQYNDKGEALFEYNGIEYDANNYIRVKVSKPFRNWTL